MALLPVVDGSGGGSPHSTKVVVHSSRVYQLPAGYDNYYGNLEVLPLLCLHRSFYHLASTGSFGVPGSSGRLSVPQYKQCQMVADSQSGTKSSACGVTSWQVLHLVFHILIGSPQRNSLRIPWELLPLLPPYCHPFSPFYGWGSARLVLVLQDAFREY